MAVKPYTVNSLYLFGLEKNCMHPAIKHLILTEIIHESKRTKARENYILKMIEKHQKSIL
tara:strand:+ start:5050 stop:5229 length:180 start_codon:yes stop_codon:yes gene_type:complete